MRHSLWLTIQSPSPTIFQPQHSAGRGDKDRCDEKQPRQQAYAPLSHERLNSNLPEDHSNVSEFGLLVRTLPGLVRNAQIRWKRAGRGRRPNLAAYRTIGADFRRWRRKRLLAFGFERVV